MLLNGNAAGSTGAENPNAAGNAGTVDPLSAGKDACYNGII
jgi:hypothetical protein